MKRLSFLLSVFIVLSIYISCKHKIIIPSTTDTGIIVNPGSTGRTCSADSVYFANDIYPLISSTCAMSGCHNATSRKAGIDLTSYSQIVAYVVPGSGVNSKLYKEIIQTGSSRMPPPPMPAWTSTQISVFKKWIDQGAKNNSCDACDTTKYTYAAAIKPIIQNKCQGCHNPSLLSGNVDLSTYTGLKAIAVNGKLYGCISWATGYSAMPKALKLPNCEIIQIKKWIDSGSPNN